MDNLEQYKSQLRDLLPEKGGIFLVDSLLEKLPEQSQHYNALISLKKRYKELKINSISGVLTTEEQSRLEAVLDKQLLELVQMLEASDFDPNARRSQLADKQKIRRGHVLYRVPKQMQLEEEYRCLVRIAFDEEMVLEDLERDGDTALKSGVRISQYMKVEIKDPNSDPVFEIRSSSEPVQFIDEDDFTEWRFFVKPLKAGKYMLELTVTIIQRINGEDRMRERTLEENVVIITEPVAEADESLPWQRDEETLAMPVALHSVTPQSTSGSGGWMRNAAMSLALLLAISSGVYAFAPTEQVDWMKARYLQDSEKGYNNFLAKHPNSSRQETAKFRGAKAILRDKPKEQARGVEAMANYVEDYGRSGQHAEEAYWTLATRTQEPDYNHHYLNLPGPNPHDDTASRVLAEQESRFWASIISQPNVLQLDRYLRLYPQGEYRESIIRQLADNEVWQRGATLPVGTLRDTSGWQQRLLDYAAELTAVDIDIAEKLRQFAANGRLPKVSVRMPQLTPNATSSTEPGTGKDAKNNSNQSTQGTTTDATNTSGLATGGSDNNSGDANSDLQVTSSSATGLPDNQGSAAEGQTPPGEQGDSEGLQGSEGRSTSSTDQGNTSSLEGTSSNTNGNAGETPGSTGSSSATAGGNTTMTTSTNTGSQTPPAQSSPQGSDVTGGSSTTGETITPTDTSPEATPSPEPREPASPAVRAIADGLVRIPGDSFMMGCQEDSDTECDSEEGPAREVRVSTFYLAKHEVTQAEWQAVMGTNPSFNSGCDQCPVEQVSWNDVQAFLKELNAQTGKNYRLPSEAEWEYAARGGRRSNDYLYSGGNNIEAVGWYQRNARSGNLYGSQKSTRPVGGLKPNALGLYDMSGNVREWVQDCWHDTYDQAPTDSQAWLGTEAGDCAQRVLRGGSWGNRASDCRVTARMRIKASERLINFGFRLARSGS